MTVLVGLAVGIGLAVLFMVNRQAPTHDESASAVPSVEVIGVQPLAFRLEARGYGAARPAETWQAVANVPGRVVERHPDLESGTLLRKGTRLLALDPSRYRLAIAEAEAELAGLAGEKDQVDAEAENIRRLLRLERDRLSLAEQEMSRIESLAEKGTVSSSKRDEQIRATLAQRQAVFSLENQLRVLPSRRERLEAQVERAKTRLEQARQDLEDTRFVAPYDLRLREVDVEMHQHVKAGQRIFQADNIETAEVEAHIPISMMRRLMGSAALLQPGPDALDLTDWLDFSAIHARVVLVGAEGVQWSARVSRVASGLDPRSRTVRVVVTVDEPYRDARPPDRPPLQRNMYVRVHLSNESPEPLLAVPAAAVHQGTIYRVDKDDRLEIQPVQVSFEQNDLAVIREGLAPGDRVIVDDPVPALHGMSVKPIRDMELERRLQRSAAGEAP